METISQYPELMSAMKHYNDNNSFEKVIWSNFLAMFEGNALRTVPGQ